MKKQITKSYLEFLGITEVTPDGKVFTKNGERKPCLRSKPGKYSSNKGYLNIVLHDPNKYKTVPKEKRNDNSGKVSILLHHLVYAWFNGEVPYGKEIHHIDEDHFNNSIDNLEALTPSEHRAKHAAMKESQSTRELKCRLDIPRTWYEKKLEEFIKEGKRSAAEHTRARLRYYDSHIEEATKVNEFRKDLIELEYWKDRFKEAGNKTMWHECCKVLKIAKEKKLEAAIIVEHALDVIHKTFSKYIINR